MAREFAYKLLLSTLLAGLIIPSTECLADAWIDSHDGAETVWKSPNDSQAEIVSQKRIRLGKQGVASDNSVSAIGAEQIVYQCPIGYSAWWWRDVPPAAIIDELKVYASIRATQPGTLLAAEIVLPRTIDPKTNTSMRLLIRPQTRKIAGPGNVEHSLAEFPLAVARAIRARRISLEKPTKIDPTGAYLQRVAIGTPGAIQNGTVWIKELSIEGIVQPLSLAKRSPAKSQSINQFASQSTPNSQPSVESKITTTEVKLGSHGFRIDNKPFFPIAWLHRGESFAELSDLGFNTVVLNKLPTEQQLQQASLHSLKLICPATDKDNFPKYNASWSPVLAWTVAGSSSKRSLDSHLAQVEDARQLPESLMRPVVIQASDTINEWSRIADGLILGQTHSRLTSEDDAQLRMAQSRQRLSPGTPLLASVSCDLSQSTMNQIDAFIGEGVTPSWLPIQGLQHACYEALAAGCRGLIFQSTEPLHGADQATLRTKAWLKNYLANLKLIRPWLLSPEDPLLLEDGTGFLLERDGVRLVVPSPNGSLTQDHLVLPGVGGVNQLYRLTPCGLKNSQVVRISGGVRTDRPAGYAQGYLLISNDPRVVVSLRKYTAKAGPSIAKEIVSLATERLAQTESLSVENRKLITTKLGEAKLALVRNEYREGYDLAMGVIDAIEKSDQYRRSIALENQNNRLSSPLSVLPSTLTDHFRLAQILSVMPRGSNRLYAGSFEDMDEARRLGWRRPAASQSIEGTSVELVAGSPIHGSNSLRLSSHTPSATGELAPKIISPKIELDAGEMIEITGWCRVSQDNKQRRMPTSSFLRIEDSLGGRELSLEISENENWQPFQLLRRATYRTSLEVTFSVEGTATAMIDGVMIRPIQPATNQTGTASRPSNQPK